MAAAMGVTMATAPGATGSGDHEPQMSHSVPQDFGHTHDQRHGRVWFGTVVGGLPGNQNQWHYKLAFGVHNQGTEATSDMPSASSSCQ